MAKNLATITDLLVKSAYIWGGDKDDLLYLQVCCGSGFVGIEIPENPSVSPSLGVYQNLVHSHSGPHCPTKAHIFDESLNKRTVLRISSASDGAVAATNKCIQEQDIYTNNVTLRLTINNKAGSVVNNFTVMVGTGSSSTVSKWFYNAAVGQNIGINQSKTITITVSPANIGIKSRDEYLWMGFSSSWAAARRMVYIVNGTQYNTGVEAKSGTKRTGYKTRQVFANNYSLRMDIHNY
jgi:hypothetical protein